MNLAVLCGITHAEGGLYYAVSSLSRVMVEANDVCPTVYGADNPFVKEDASAWGSVPTVAYKAFGPLQSSLQLRGLLREANPEILHLHGLWTDSQWAALQWQKKSRKPVVVSPHGMLDPWAVKNSAWKKKLVGKLFANEALGKAHCIHALCQSEADSIRAYGLDNPIAIIPNGIELPEVGEKKFSDGKKTLLFLGRIHPKKGMGELLDAWGVFSGDWKLLVAGWDDGGHEAGLRAKVDELGIGDSVEFIGPQFGEAKEQLLRNADAFILPSFSEGLPMTVLEAWAYRLPVVMTDFCNLPEGYDAGAAIRIEPEAKSILQGLNDLAALTDEGLRSIGSIGRTLVEQRFTWPKIAKDMQAVYAWCLGGDKPSCIR